MPTAIEGSKDGKFATSYTIAFNPLLYLPRHSTPRTAVPSDDR
jgi:hypothetical protein